jgi:hypothetical protein
MIHETGSPTIQNSGRTISIRMVGNARELLLTNVDECSLRELLQDGTGIVTIVD